MVSRHPTLLTGRRVPDVYCYSLHVGFPTCRHSHTKTQYLPSDSNWSSGECYDGASTIHDNGCWTTRGYAKSWTGHLVDWSTRGLDNSHTGQLADATCDFACLVFVFFGHRETASCPVHETSSLRVGESASCPVTMRIWTYTYT